MATSEAAVRERLAARLDFRRVVAGTTLLVLATMLLGVATKATGAGLACNARWPVCDGGFLNLFPQSFPSFFEWLHRVVAGVTGFAILGAAWLAWQRETPRRARYLVTLGLVLLPLQVYFGRQTVLQFTAPILTLHFWTAFTILSSFVAATAIAWRDELTPERLRNATAAAALLLPLQVLLHPPIVTQFTPVIHTLQYLVTITVFSSVLAAAIAGRNSLDHRGGRVLVALAFVEPVLVYAGRHMYAPGTPLLSVYLVFAAVLFVGLLWATFRFHDAR